MTRFGEEVKIYIKYDGQKPTYNKKYNKDLVKYLKLNIDVLNVHGNFIDIQLVDKHDKASCEKLEDQKKIKRLPVLISRNRPNKRIYGVPEITYFLKKLCNNRVRATAKKPDEEIRDYQMFLLEEVGDDNTTDNYNKGIAANVAMSTVETQKRKDRINQLNVGGARGRRERRDTNHRGEINTNGVFFNEDGRDHNGDNRRSRSQNVAMKDNPAEIQRSCGGRDYDSVTDNDLMAAFWDARTETKM